MFICVRVEIITLQSEQQEFLFSSFTEITSLCFSFTTVAELFVFFRYVRNGIGWSTE